jgi:hypothetical protein
MNLARRRLPDSCAIALSRNLVPKEKGTRGRAFSNSNMPLNKAALPA